MQNRRDVRGGFLYEIAIPPHQLLPGKVGVGVYCPRMPLKPEKEEIRMPFVPFPPAIRRERDVLEEVQRPCSRFKSPLSWEEGMDLNIARLGTKMSSLTDALLCTDDVPPNWSALARYLHTQGITDSTRFSFPSIRNDVPKTFSVRLSPRSDASDTDGRAVGRHGFGSTSSVEESMSRAVGELLERYYLSVYRRADLLTMSFRDAARQRTKPLDIFGLNDFLPWQKELFPAFVRDVERPITWVAGRELLSGARALIPAQLAYWGYTFEKGEMILAQSNTNGGAGHFSSDEATLAALLELIQRDGFLIYWLNTLSPKRIDPSTIIDRDVKEFLNYLHRYRFEYHFLNITTDIGVPSCACVLIDNTGEEPVISVGGAAGFSLKELILQSAGEALAIHEFTTSHARHELPSGYKPFTEKALGRSERLALWKGQDRYEQFKFFISGPLQSFEGFIGDAVWHTTPQARLAYILDRMKTFGKGYEVYSYEVEHPVLKTLGYHVVRAIVPRLMHLYLNEHMATLAAPRLREVPVKLGYAAAQMLNPWPHPFP